MHDEYIKARELLAVELDREPTSGEIDEKMADMEAKKIDDIFEQRQQAKIHALLPCETCNGASKIPYVPIGGMFPDPRTPGPCPDCQEHAS